MEVAEDLAGCGGDADVDVLEQDQHGLVGVAAADPDVVEPAVVAEGEFAPGVDGVVAAMQGAVDSPQGWSYCLELFGRQAAA